jgi:hypothetical protein
MIKVIDFILFVKGQQINCIAIHQHQHLVLCELQVLVGNTFFVNLKFME